MCSIKQSVNTFLKLENTGLWDSFMCWEFSQITERQLILQPIFKTQKSAMVDWHSFIDSETYKNILSLFAELWFSWENSQTVHIYIMSAHKTSELDGVFLHYPHWASSGNVWGKWMFSPVSLRKVIGIAEVVNSIFDQYWTACLLG